MELTDKNYHNYALYLLFLQEFLKLWDDLKEAENDNITVEEMFQSIKERETIAMVTSTPANQKLLTSQEWKMVREKLY